MSAFGGRLWSALRPGGFYLSLKSPYYRFEHEAVEKKKLYFSQQSNSGSPIAQPLAQSLCSLLWVLDLIRFGRQYEVYFWGAIFSVKPSNSIWNAMEKVGETDDGWREGGDNRRASGCCASVGSGKQGLKRETMFKGAAQAAQVFPPILILLHLTDMKEQSSCKRQVNRTGIYRKWFSSSASNSCLCSFNTALPSISRLSCRD